MKKLLLTLATVAVTASVSWADDPVFPDNFTIETSSSGVSLCTMEDIDPTMAMFFEDNDAIAYSFGLKGATNADVEKITIAIPDGWDGFLFSPPGEMEIPGMMRKANAVEMIPISAYDEDGNYSKGNSFSIPADGKTYFIQGYLYKGEEMDINNQIACMAKITKNESVANPAFPEKFNITLNDKGLSLEQEGDDSEYYVTIEGESAEEVVTATFEVPEGWDGFYCLSYGDFEMPEPLLSRKRVSTRSVDDADMWMPLSELEEEWPGIKEGNTITMKVGGRMEGGILYLFKGENAYNAMIYVEAALTQKEGDDDPAFPDNFTVTTNPANLEVEQLPAEEWGGEVWPYEIIINGKTSESTATITIDVPEGWTDFVWVNKDINFGSKKKAKAEWEPKEDLLSGGYTSGNVIEVKADGRGHEYAFMLCKGDQVDTANEIKVTVTLNREFPGLTFPDELDVKLSAEGLTIEHENQGWSYDIMITGECAVDNFTATFTVPEGWDGFIGAVFDMEEEEYSANMRSKKAVENIYFQPITTLDGYDQMEKVNKFNFAADGKDHYGVLYLYKDDMACNTPISLMVNATGTNDGPTFPEEFVITTDPADLEVEQIPAEDFMGWPLPYTIEVNGKCTEKTATITIEVPEGWTNFIWQNQDISFGSRKKAQAVWESKADLLAEGYTEGNVIELPVDSRSHTYYLYLCNGDQVDTANDIQLDVMLNRSFPDLTFPETFDITLSSEGPKVEQTSDEWEFEITITGECMGETITATFDVPEGWDGFVGATDSDVEDPDINPLSTRAEEDLIFMPLEIVENGDVPLKKGNEFTFPADGEEHYGMAFLYKDDMACYKQINMMVNVLNKQSGINNIDTADSEARYFNLQGVEVTNPEKGVYVKVANGKASKVNVK